MIDDAATPYDAIAFRYVDTLELFVSPPPCHAIATAACRFSPRRAPADDIGFSLYVNIRLPCCYVATPAIDADVAAGERNNQHNAATLITFLHYYADYFHAAIAGLITLAFLYFLLLMPMPFRQGQRRVIASHVADFAALTPHAELIRVYAVSLPATNNNTVVTTSSSSALLPLPLPCFHYFFIIVSMPPC